MGEHTAFLLLLAATLTLSSEVSATRGGLGCVEGESGSGSHGSARRRLCFGGLLPV